MYTVEFIVNGVNKIRGIFNSYNQASYKFDLCLKDTCRGSELVLKEYSTNLFEDGKEVLKFSWGNPFDCDPFDIN